MRMGGVVESPVDTAIRAASPPLDDPCRDLARLAERVVLALLVDRVLAEQITSGLLRHLRSVKRPSISHDEARLLIAKAAFDTAWPFVDRTPLPLDEAGSAPDRRMAAFAGLAPRARVIVVLREIESMSFDRIGRVVGEAEVSVTTALFRARRTLDAAGSTSRAPA